MLGCRLAVLAMVNLMCRCPASAPLRSRGQAVYRLWWLQYWPALAPASNAGESSLLAPRWLLVGRISRGGTPLRACHAVQAMCLERWLAGTEGFCVLLGRRAACTAWAPAGRTWGARSCTT